MQERIKGIKSSEEVGVRYMQAWEERILEIKEAKEEGRDEILKELIQKKLAKGKTIENIADELERDVKTIEQLLGESESTT